MMPPRIILVLFALLATLSACRMSPEGAREKLAQQNIPSSEAEFFKRVEDGDASVVELFLIAGANANAMTDPGFRITDQLLETLKGKGVPDDILKKLENQKDQKVMGEDNFLSVLKSTIGDEPTVKFQSVVLQYAKSDNGQTALMAAARKGHTVVVKALLDARADANGKNRVGETALLVAAFNGHSETVKTLLNAKADVNAKDDNGATPLMAAAYKGQTSCVETLLAGGVDANAMDKKGETAVMQAAEQGHNDALQVLLASGADAKARNALGFTALLKAFSNGHAAVVQSLLTSSESENPGTATTTPSTVVVNAHIFAAGGFLSGSIEVPGGKVVLTPNTSGEISVNQIAIVKVDWEQINTSHYLESFTVLGGGNVKFERHLMSVTAKLTPKKLEVLLRNGQTLEAELEKVKPDKLGFVTQVDGKEVRLDLPLKFFEADYTNEDSRRRLTLDAPISRKDKGWKVKYVMVDFT